MDSIEKIGRKGERYFADLCNAWRYEYLHIGQDKADPLSSEMFNNHEKRPDFLINLRDIAPIFVDVKVKKMGTNQVTGTDAFGINREEMTKSQNFAASVRISTWYSIFEQKENEIEHSVAFLCPLSRIEKWIPDHSKDNSEKWGFSYVPTSCMNLCENGLDTSDKCQTCSVKYCEKNRIKK